MGPERAVMMSPLKSSIDRGIKFSIHLDSHITPMDPPDEILKLLSVSTGGSWVVNNWDEVKKYKPEATLGAVYKDLTAVMKECTKNQLSLPFGGLALHVLIDSMSAMNRDFDM
ncbi:hypothetical protein [Peribacillus butanolivorans]|uniref:hypothetical protein n=1 Tax=Peribacillus butanolivorans TaxID=421767 RepID=UPI0035D9B8BB